MERVHRRESNFDILRSLAMLSIVLAHALNYGMYKGKEISFYSSMNSLFYPLFSTISSLGVELFVLITGYFLSGTTMRLDKIGKIWVETFFYSLVIALIFQFGTSYDVKLIDFVFPIRNNQYWFVTQYLGLLLLAPFLNLLVNILSKKKFQGLLFVLFMLVCTISFNIPYGNIIIEGAGTSLFLFIYIFLIGAYFRKHGFPHVIQMNSGKFFLILLLLQWLGGIAINMSRPIGLYGGFSISYNGLSLLTAIMFFVYFKEIKVKDHLITRLILKTSSLTFGVYLIHEHACVRHWIWKEQLDLISYWNLPYYWIIVILLCLAIFVICIMIDDVRRWLFEVFRITDLIDACSSKLYRIFSQKENLF
ncbi:acyltransferase [Bacteroides thetaiotaomicron]|uniref:acyltransferase family protein n=1 Tax=Bacteroides thetaiotaomicron TaxID=818 RepID=UPI0021665574|nr:acyltransferase [Bacteroides thetaiotaomicron]MCS2449220.1 acyltransferase [Bacteroides thetaiotaomicron]